MTESVKATITQVVAELDHIIDYGDIHPDELKELPRAGTTTAQGQRVVNNGPARCRPHLT